MHSSRWFQCLLLDMSGGFVCKFGDVLVTRICCRNLTLAYITHPRMKLVLFSRSRSQSVVQDLNPGHGEARAWFPKHDTLMHLNLYTFSTSLYYYCCGYCFTCLRGLMEIKFQRDLVTVHQMSLLPNVGNLSTGLQGACCAARIVCVFYMHQGQPGCSLKLRVPRLGRGFHEWAGWVPGRGNDVLSQWHENHF